MATACSLILIAYAVVRNTMAAMARPLWYDELCTVAVANQPNLAALWGAFRGARDSSTLLYVLIVHVFARTIPNAQIAYRLPSIVGFGCLLWCLFVFIRKNESGVCAFVCSCLMMMTPLYTMYAIEARSYSLLVASIAIALVCYQRVSHRFWLLCFGTALTAAEALHYYGFFSFAPFVLAEFAFTIKMQQFRWGVWLCFVSGFVPLVCSWSVLKELKAFYGPHLFAKPTFAVVRHAYDGFFGTRIEHMLPGIGFAFAVGLAVAALRGGISTKSGIEPAEKANISSEPLLAVGLMSVPFVGFAATTIGHGQFLGRYVLPVALGVAIAVPYVLSVVKVRKLALLMLGALLLSFISVKELHFWRFEHPARFDSPSIGIQNLLAVAKQQDLPIVVSDAHTYLQLAYYSPPVLGRRLVSLVDPPKAVSYTGTDTLDLQIVALKCCFSLQTYQFSDFASDHSRFLLYSDGGNFDWWPSRLRDDRYRLERIASEGGSSLYLIFLGGPGIAN
jgi:hypothetical protein